MLYTIESKSSLATVKQEMESKAKEIGFGVLKEYNFKEILKEKGFPIEKEITVFEICNPVAAQEALSMHPEISAYLPCRISVYEKDGKTILSTIAIEDMLNSFELDSSFKNHMNNIFNNLKKLISSWQ
ncbi:DUF302 domain-containing protein [Sulfurimonas sp.]|uniref:DUF302 domain-containing protein n=1 Tax=Sulfurimonas sp. TaxID=2022749 RepID=UPI00356907F5